MTAIKKGLYETIDLFPDEIAKELLNYADFLALKYLENKMPDNFVVQDDEELKKKLQERIEKIESGKGRMLSIEEAFIELDKI